MKRRTTSRLLAPAAMIAILGLVSCAGVGTCPPPPRPWEFTIVGTADLQGQLDEAPASYDMDGDGVKETDTVGGIARLATLISGVKRERPGRVAVVSTGDDLMNRYFHTFKGKAIFELMSDAGYEIYAFGNHEFDKGPEVLGEALSAADFTVVASDLSVAGTPLEGLCQPLLVRDYEGLRVGYFSLMTEAFPMVTSGESVELSRGNLETAHWAVRELKARGAHIIVALTHIGYSNDLELARSVPGIDIIFGGHSHDYHPEMARMGGTLIVNGGEKGPYLVRLDVTVDVYGRMDLESADYRLVPVTADVVPGEAIESKLASYHELFPEAVVLGRTDVEWNMTKEIVREGESPVANLVSDHMRTKFKADVVVNNAGAFRGKKVYEAGPITDVMLHEIDEFSNYAFTLDIKGSYLKEILENGASNFGEGGFLQVSGLRYVIDLNEAPQILEADADGEWRVATPGSRVRDVEVLDESGRWLPLNPERSYRVLSNSFMVKDAGDGYYWFRKHGTNLVNTYSTFYSILAELAGAQDVLNPEEPDGRVTILR